MRVALASFPGYPFALDGLAQAEAALGHLRRARALEAQAVARVPLPQYVALLGDLEGALGHRAAAAKQYALIGVIERLLAANGVRNDLDIALFDADHGRNPARTVVLARKGYAERPSILGDDVLGWALARDRSLRRGAAVLDARAAARHEGRAEDLPPRLRRRVPRPSRGGAHVLPARARDQPALLDPVGARRPEGSIVVKKLLVVLVAAAALLAPAVASAHPLGNFTINRFARVEVAGHQLYVRYVLDIAEIPTYQARQDGVDPAVYARRLARGLHVTVDGRPVALQPIGTRARIPARRRRPAHDAARGDPPGTDGRRHRVGRVVHDTNYAGRIGWKEIVVGSTTHSVSRRAARVPEEPSPKPTRRDARAGDHLAHRHAASRSSRQGGRSRRPTASPTVGSRS